MTDLATNQFNETFTLRESDVVQLLKEYRLSDVEALSEIEAFLKQEHQTVQDGRNVTTNDVIMEANEMLMMQVALEQLETSTHPLKKFIENRIIKVIEDAASRQPRLTTGQRYVSDVIRSMEMELGREALSSAQLDILGDVVRAGYSDLTGESTIERSITTYIGSMLKIEYVPDYQTFWNKKVKEAAYIGLYQIIADAGLSEQKATALRTALEASVDSYGYHHMSHSQIVETIVSIREVLRSDIRGEARTKIRNRTDKQPDKLTDDEIRGLLEVVSYPGNLHQVSDMAQINVRYNLENQLRKVRIEKPLIGTLRKELLNRFKAALVNDDHAVGLIAAQSVGETSSQAGLRSFHHAGITAESGYPRTKAILELSETPKKMFTFVGLKGQPTFKEARIYASSIAMLTIGDLATADIGRTSEDVADVTGGSNVYPEEPWVTAYTALMNVMGGKSKRGSFVRPPWIVRLTFNKDRMFQNRLDPVTVANAIEARFRNKIRVIPSDLATGVADIYWTGGFNMESLATDTESDTIVAFLTKTVMTEIFSIQIKGVPGFDNTLVEVMPLSKYIVSVDQGDSRVGEDRLVIHMNKREMNTQGVRMSRMIDFLAMKTDTDASHFGETFHGRIVYRPGDSIIKSPEALKCKIRDVESVSLEEIITSTNATDESVVASINRQLVVSTHEIDPVLLAEFFDQQQTIRALASVNIDFNRNNFQVTVSQDPGFTSEYVWQLLQDEEKMPMQIKYSEIIVDDESSFHLDNVSKDMDLPTLVYLVDGFRNTVTMTTTTNADDSMNLSFKLTKMTAPAAWKILRGVDDDTPVLFTSVRRERLANHIRVVANGGSYIAGTANKQAPNWGVNSLSMLPFVDIETTIPSNPHEINHVLGIDAAASYIYSELLQNAGNIEERHVALIADQVTYIGILSKLSIGGAGATQDGVLVQAAMEQCLNTMTYAAAGNVKDDINDTVAQTLIGNFEKANPKATKYIGADEQETDSAIDLLMGSMLATTTAKGRKVIRGAQTRQARVKKEVDDDDLAYDPEFDGAEEEWS